MKGHAQSYSNNGNGGGAGSRKGRMYTYGLMVVLAFGAAMCGGMLLHKLRDTQLLNNLLSHKDRHLLSLQLLLQKERAYASETKRKSEQMKANIYSLRTQKTELSSKILKMQSTISSLKEELRTMESTLEEKQNEIKLLREKRTDSNNENPQVTALSKTLKQREAEIEDFKHRFDLPVKVWSVSTDDPSNPTVNLTVKVTTENGENYRDKNSMIDRDVSGNGNGSVGSEDRENSTQDEDSREMNGEEQFQQRKNSREGEITGEKRRRFFKDESESERGDRIHDGELKRETEHQDYNVINMTNKSVEKKRYIEHFELISANGRIESGNG